MSDETIEARKLELDTQRLELEKERLALENGFAKKYAAPLLSVLVAVVAGAFAFGQVWIASINRDKELELSYIQKDKEAETSRIQNERRWKLDIADFVFKNREIIFSRNIDEQRRLRDVMLVTFPSEVTAGLFERIVVAVPQEQKQLWQDGQELASKLETAETTQGDALALFRKGQFEAAVSAYDKGLEFDKNNVKLLNWKGYSLFRSKKFEEAISTLTLAVKIRPDYELANLNLAKALCATGKFSEASRIMTDANNIKPLLVQTALADGEFVRNCKPILNDLEH